MAEFTIRMCDGVVSRFIYMDFASVSWSQSEDLDIFTSFNRKFSLEVSSSLPRQRMPVQLSRKLAAVSCSADPEGSGFSFGRTG